MTTGSWSTGTIASNGFLAVKQWSGTDGKLPAYPFSRTPRWNRYRLSHHKARLTARGQPTGDWDRVRILTESTGTISVDSDATNSTRVSFVNFNTTQGDILWAQKWTPSDELRLLARLIDKVKGHSFNMGVSLAEVDKLASTMLTSIKTLTYGLDALIRGHYRDFFRHMGTSPPRRFFQRNLELRDVSGRWLEVSYAVKPVINDAYEAVKAFEALSRGPRRAQVKVSRSKAYQTVVDSEWTTGVIKGRAQRTYTYEAYEELGFLRQIGVMNPASIIWERIPWSFVIDWFIPVGTYLELIGQIPFLKGRFLRTDSLEEDWAGYTQLKRVPFGSTFKRCVQPLLWSDPHWFWQSRVPLSSLSVPRPQVKVHGAIHGQRILNAIALSHQRLSRSENYVRTRGTGQVDFGGYTE